MWWAESHCISDYHERPCGADSHRWCCSTIPTASTSAAAVAFVLTFNLLLNPVSHFGLFVFTWQTWFCPFIAVLCLRVLRLPPHLKSSLVVLSLGIPRSWPSHRILCVSPKGHINAPHLLTQILIWDLVELVDNAFSFIPFQHSESYRGTVHTLLL